MENEGEIRLARELYAKCAIDFWVVLNERGHKPANRISNKARSLLESWGERGKAVDLLYPLLSHEQEAVRLAAATGLLDYGAPAQAIAVLRDISKNPEGFMAVTARILLRKHGISSLEDGSVH
ncbi:HEAT repeat domain-containing protein [Ralstonia pseudosolanacearum]|uniref:HEAT repeat domain-containing protein n=1 Tax=Ralstonia nicotianae (strain ATCC BAA-1114 / GMI1000) TaxID=267608 RepID=Q8XTL4_RALN1|nr:HEAT repeat domain-containing protein [Ralstonia pseudosolanacearum]AST29172.1 hypothetical protein CDC45_18040 [Ralstonia pseudosolanacearum]MCQ4677811.1 HEAT repeat domain-containing protein [Ralstonia pseudosolanacearum]MDC6285397.1 HEAT repeat domain-containing protein [Ralstonia pseudosolanacearum]MDC6296494.1 HEAT repeat domain-containing protein [Ralstonia pseudosolanacearum]MDD7792442.1 HEAT repeat domain-containing protein [Ralstonia pseudosolanacearum]